MRKQSYKPQTPHKYACWVNDVKLIIINTMLHQKLVHVRIKGAWFIPIKIIFTPDDENG